MSDKILKYKSYFGSIECDLDEGVLFGKVLHIRDLVTFESDTVKGLQQEFQSAVDDYLATCAEIGKSPNKPYTGSFNVRIGPDLHYEAAIYASVHNMNLNQVMLESVRSFLNPEVSEFRVNHDHNVHHEHVVVLNDNRVGATKAFDFNIPDYESFPNQDDQWPFLMTSKTSSQGSH